MNRYDVISIFPEYLAPLNLSLIGKAQENNLVDIEIHDLRKYAVGNHKSVDDTPYGGGAGMVMSPEPWGRAIDSMATEKNELIVLTPAGKKFDQAIGREKNGKSDQILVQLDAKPYPYQQEILERLWVERDIHNHWRNLVVAATGTGKTVMAALDYQNLNLLR